MKKRTLSLLLVVAMLLSMVVLPIGGEAATNEPAAENAVTDNVTAVTEQCPCGCGPIYAVNWQPYNYNTTKATMGHFYLDGNYAQDGQCDVISGSDMVIDLRGYTLTSKDYNRLFKVEGYMAVLDTVGGGRIQSKTSGGAYGGVVMVRENETKGTTFELYSGTLTVDPDNKSSVAGGLVYVSGDRSVFRMHGGLLLGGSTATNGTLTTYGGAVAVVSPTASVEILGGMITDCSSVTQGGAIYSLGTTKLKNCRIVNCSSDMAGGAVYQAGGSLTAENCQFLSNTAATHGGTIYGGAAVSLKDCQIWNGTATKDGGNIFQSGGSLTTENCDIAFGTSGGDSGGGNVYVASTEFTDNGSTIRDGAAMGAVGSGGNILVGSGTHNLTGTKVYGGVSQKYGANIVSWTKNTTRMEDVEIAGDMRWSPAGLTLAGATKIGLCNNGLNLVGGSATSAISASELTEGAEIFVSAAHGTKFTTDSVNMDYFKPALRTVITQNDDGTLTGRMVDSGEVGGYCPHCYDPANPQKVTWTAFGTGVFRTECYADTTNDTNPACTSEQYHIQSGHYYMNKSLTSTSNGAKRFKIHAGDDVVIDLNGYTMTGPYRSFVAYEGSSLSILDFNGAGIVQSVGGIDYTGGVIFGQNPFTLNIYGGSYKYNANTSKHVLNGGIIYAPAGSTVNIHGGNFDASSFNKTTASAVGGVIDMADTTTTYTGNSTLNISAGRFIGGTTYRGGVLYLGNRTTTTITGGLFTGGTATNGGPNIRSTKMMTMKNCAVIGGVLTGDANIASGNRTYYAGNVYLGGTSTVENCYIAGGEITVATGCGGNLYCGGTVTLKDSVIVGGTAPKGGNIYIASVSAKLDMIDNLVMLGEAIKVTGSTGTDGCGGNLFANNGFITLSGGEFSYGDAMSNSGNIQAHTGCGDMTTYPDAADDKLVLTGGVKLFCGHANNVGGNITTDGITQFVDVEISGGRADNLGQDAYITNYNSRTAFTFGAELKGDIRMGIDSSLLTRPVYGKEVYRTTATAYAANITLDGDFGEPSVLVKAGKLYIAEAKVIGTDGSEQWYCTNADAVNACGADQYVKLYSTNALTLNKDCFVDLNGKTVSVSGSGTLYGMDNTGDTYKIPTGKATWANAEAVKTGEISYAPNGNKYVAVADGADVTYHRLGMEITDVALRPSNSGIYYKGNWKCDTVLADMVQEYGIAVSTANMPAANFRNEAAEGEEATTDNLWVAYDGKKMNGSIKCGVLISNIFKDGKSAEENQERGEMPVYATAYLTLKNGATFVSDNPADDTDDLGYSLKSFIELVDDLIQKDPTNFRRLEKTMKDFYETWEEKGAGNWVFDRIKTAVDPATDNEYNVLMIGSSFCYYYVEELYELLVEAGYENVRVCNVYYSGCPLSYHYDWWVNGKSNYQFFVVDENGRREVSNAASLEFCLSQYNWDVISLQESGSSMRKNGVAAHFENTRLYHSTLIPYIQGEFPGARFVWHQTWPYQIGYDRDGYKMTSAEQQERDMNVQRDFALMICEEYGIDRINSGEAWQEVRNTYGYDTLCARLGKTVSGAEHEGDFYHEGDIGGGQLLNACVWFEILTGLDCTEMEYVPVYKYNGAVVENLYDADMIKQAAHTAVQNMLNAQ